MPTYRLHCFAQSGNAYKVALYLNCAGIEWEPVFVDYMAGATRDPEWRARVNPMGEVPVLEVDDKRLTQSGAILTWLADKTGKFAPKGDEQRYEALRWILFDNHKFTSVVNEHLSKTPYLLGEEPTIADFSIAGYLFYPSTELGYDFETSHKNIYAWTQRMKAIPGWKDPYDLIPGERIAPRWTSQS